MTTSCLERNMRLKALLFFLLLHQQVFGDKVVQYTDSDFDSKMDSHETALVMFYAPWCGHCKNLKPQYAKAAEDLASNDPAVSLVKVDCTDSGKATCEKYGIEGYPTLKIFHGGKFSEDYKGPRTSDGIVSFMKQQVAPKMIPLNDMEELENFIGGTLGIDGGGTSRILEEEGKEVCVIGYFNGETDFKKNFEEVAKELRGKVKFGHMDQPGIEEKMVLFRPPLLWNKFEQDLAVFNGNMNPEEIKQFIKYNFHGLVGIRKPGNVEEFDKPLVVVYFDVDFERNPKGSKYWRNRVLRVARDFKDRVNFAISNKNDFLDELTEYGQENFDSSKPVIYAWDSDMKYVMDDPFSSENLTIFVQKLLDQQLEPWVKSEPVPPVNDGPVKVAVAKNYDQVVRDNGKDTLIAFYVPWCNRCKKLEKGYEELAKKLKGEVEFVKMDANANRVPPEFHNIHDYPTVFWLSKEKKDEPIRYYGRNKFHDIIKFLANQSTDGLKDYDRDGNVKTVEIPKKTEL